METAPDFQGINAVQEGKDMPVTDSWDMNHGDLNSEALNSNGEGKEVGTPAGHVTENNPFGLVKPIAKWTRIPRMDCGLEKGDEGIPLPNLGKRGSAHRGGEEDVEKNDKQGVKRGKLQDDSLSISAVGVFDYPCRSQ